MTAPPAIAQDFVPLANPELKKIGDRVANTVILAAEKVSVETAFKPAIDTYEAILKERLSSFDSKKVASIKERALPLYKGDKEIRTNLYGELGNIVLKDVVSAELAEQQLAPVKVNRTTLGFWKPPPGAALSAPELDALRDAQSEIFSADDVTSMEAITGGGTVTLSDFDDDDEPSADDVDVPSDELATTKRGLPPLKKLRLRIRKVKCVDETSPEWFKHDRIALSGVSVDEDGDTKKIREKYIGGGFDDGDYSSWSPAWKWHSFSLREGGKNWPKSYYLTFVLAEKDMGGLSKFAQKLYEKVRSHVKRAIISAIGQLIPLGKIIGPVVAYVVDKIFGWIINIWRDDIFPPRVVSCTVRSYYSRFIKNGKKSRSSETKRVDFYGHGGHYYIHYYWQLY